MRNRNLLSLVVFLLALVSYGQEKPYPQNLTYEYGFMSSKITSTDAWSEYQSWISSYYVECSSSEARINYNGATVSEGIGYGLVITAYAGDKTKFDKLWNYYKNRQNGSGVMNWEYQGCGTGASGSGSATDGDMDAVMGLLVATIQWPNQGYDQKFETLANSIRNSEFTNCGLIVQKPGNAWGGCDCTNPSYYAPGYYRAFAKYYEKKGNNDAKNFWNQAANDSYTVLFKNQNSSTGLVSAWTNTSGAAGPCGGQVGGGGGPDTYQYDACRTPWRIATDYLWWGNADAKTFLTRVVGFVKTGIGGIDKVVDGYALNGTKQGQWHNTPFVGSFALSGMATSQADADNFMTHFQTMKGDNYFNTCLSVMYKFLATGNYWNPYGSFAPVIKCSQVNLGTEKTLCGSGTVTLNAGVPTQANRTFTWKRGTTEVQTGSGNTYNATVAGTYTVVMDSAGKCSSTADVVVSATLPTVNLGADIFLKPTSVLDAGVSGSGVTYKWYLDGTVISGATSQTLAISQTGTYKVEVSATGCTTQSDEIKVSQLPSITKTNQTITVDGTVEDVYVNFKDVTKLLSGAIGGTNLSASWTGVWNATNLYIVVKVVDSDKKSDSGDSWYEDDGVEIFIDGNNSKNSSYDGSNDFQWGFVWNSTSVRAGGSNPSNSTTGITFSIVGTTDGYVLEASIPWTKIGITPTIGTTIGIDIAINDDDGGGSRDNKISWNASVDDGWKNPSLFGSADLIDAVVTSKTQTISLTPGWNLVSFWVLPANTTVSSVFSSLGNNLITVKTNDKYYSPSLASNLNTLSNIEIGIGYMVKVTNAGSLTVTGSPVASKTLQLKKGWNLIGFPFETSKSITSVISTINSSVIQIKNNSGKFANGSGTLLNMDAGKGYFINVSQNVSLSF